MKKLIVFVLTFVFILVLIGCTSEKEHTIRIVIPAGSQAEFVYSEEEISPLNSQFTVKSIDVADGTSVAVNSFLLKSLIIVQIPGLVACKSIFLTLSLESSLSVDLKCI